MKDSMGNIISFQMHSREGTIGHQNPIKYINYQIYRPASKPPVFRSFVTWKFPSGRWVWVRTWLPSSCFVPIATQRLIIIWKLENTFNGSLIFIFCCFCIVWSTEHELDSCRYQVIEAIDSFLIFNLLYDRHLNITFMKVQALCKPLALTRAVTAIIMNKNSLTFQTTGFCQC